MKRGKARDSLKTVIPDPEIYNIKDSDTYGALIAGVGGTGVITVGALLGTAFSRRKTSNISMQLRWQ